MYEALALQDQQVVPPGFMVWSVNGELLVDAGFGGNGFYLPFDPAQTGANYSSNAVATGDYTLAIQFQMPLMET